MGKSEFDSILESRRVEVGRVLVKAGRMMLTPSLVSVAFRLVRDQAFIAVNLFVQRLEKLVASMVSFDFLLPFSTLETFLLPSSFADLLSFPFLSASSPNPLNPTVLKSCRE